MANDNLIAGATVQITANTGGLEAGIASAQANINRFAASVRSIGQNSTTAGLKGIADTLKSIKTFGMGAGGGAIIGTLKHMAFWVEDAGKSMSELAGFFETTFKTSNLATQGLDIFGQAISKLGDSIGGFIHSPVRELTTGIKNLVGELQRGGFGSNALPDPEKMAAMEKASAERYAKMRQPIEALIASIQKQADTIGMTERQIAQYEAAQADATAADKQRIDSLHDVIDAHHEQQEAAKAAAKEAERNADIVAAAYEREADAAAKAANQREMETEKLIEQFDRMQESQRSSSPSDFDIQGFGSREASGSVAAAQREIATTAMNQLEQARRTNVLLEKIRANLGISPDEEIVVARF